MKLVPILLTLSIFIAATATQAAVSFDIQAEVLKTSGGATAPASTLAFLIADTSSNGFGSFTSGSSTSVNSFLNGDDKILARFDLSGGGPGILASNPTNITIAQGTPLALVWFPTLTLSSSTISSGNTYGLYTNASAVDGSSSFVAPANLTANYKLYYFNADSAALHTGGTNAANTGNATLTVAAVPEPSRVMLLGLGLGAFIVRRRRNA